MIILLTGSPGVGKTTLTQTVAAQLASQHNTSVHGFLSLERRENGRRVGFDMIDVNDPHATCPLATAEKHQGGSGSLLSGGVPGGPRVGKYRVHVAEMETFCLQRFEARRGSTPSPPGGAKKVFILDEIGKMELFSQSFKRAVVSLMDDPEAVALVTIAQKGPDFLVEVKQHRHVHRLIEVTRENRDKLAAELVQSWGGMKIMGEVRTRIF